MCTVRIGDATVVGKVEGEAPVVGDQIRVLVKPGDQAKYLLRTDKNGMDIFWIWQFPFVPAPPAQRGEFWRYAPEERDSQGIIASPSVADGVFYQGDGDGRFSAHEARSGGEIWSYEASGGIVSSPIVLGDRVYFGSRDGTLHALNRADGASIWQLDLGAPIELPPAYADGRLYVRTADGMLHAVE